MAVVDVIPLWGETCKEDEDGNLEYSKSWKVKVEPGDGPDVARYAGGIPFRGTEHPSNPAAVRKDLDVQPEASGFYIVTANYSTKYEEGEQEENPLLHPTIEDWDFAQYEVVFDKDVSTGRAIVNKAGDPIEGATKEKSRLLYTRTKNFPFFDESQATSYTDTINNATWRGYPARTWKVIGIKPTRQETQLANSGKLVYYSVAVTFAYEPLTWKKKYLNAGYRELNGTKRQNILIDGAFPSSPVPLDNSGKQLAPNTTETYVEFNAYEEKDFSVFLI